MTGGGIGDRDASHAPETPECRGTVPFTVASAPPQFSATRGRRPVCGALGDCLGNTGHWTGTFVATSPASPNPPPCLTKAADTCNPSAAHPEPHRRQERLLPCVLRLRGTVLL